MDRVVGKMKAEAGLLLLVLLALSNISLRGQEPSAPYGHPPVARAVRVEIPPRIDGDVIDDPAWGPAEPQGEFWQIIPEEGRPATAKTEVRI
ncbi:MAG TPA: hypothetical protein PK636_09365, partial [bacterium]|nr:hypothetical protein [bacterium]